MKTKLVLPLMLISAVFVTPAFAAGNWFHNPYENINRNIGSAPNPTPADLREMRLPIVVEDPKNPTTAQAPSFWDRMFARTASASQAQQPSPSAQPSR